MSVVNWWKVRNQSLAFAAREAGYDLALYNNYPAGVRSVLKKSAIKIAMQNVCDAFKEEHDRALDEITQGVYVICLSNPFTVNYPKGRSEIIYIGRGNISGRLKGHFEGSLFDVMMGLAGANFDFYLTEPKSNEGDSYFKHIEFQLLDAFRAGVGGGNFPLLNKNAGTKQNMQLGKGWDKPLKASGKKPTWAIAPTGKRPIKQLV